MLPLNPKSSDDFQTPPHALAPLLPFLPKDKVIWECACGRGNLVKALRSEGFKVRGTDRKTGTDFRSFNPKPESLKSLMGGRRKPLGDVIVTNPPYSLKDDFIITAYNLGLPFALLMPLTAMEGKERQQYYRHYGLELIVLDERLHFEQPGGETSHSPFLTAWFCWKLTGRPLTFVVPQRVSWS